MGRNICLPHTHLIIIICVFTGLAIWYIHNEKKRHIVKPGITGLAQVNPSPLGIKSWKKSIKLDIYYVSNLSLILDIKILVKTVQLIFSMKKQFNDFKKFYE